MTICVVFSAHCDSVLVRTMNLRGNRFANICVNQVLVNISELKYCVKTSVDEINTYVIVGNKYLSGNNFLICGKLFPDR